MHKLITLLVISLLSIPLNGQTTEHLSLSYNKVNELKTGDEHIFELEAASDQFIYGYADQISVDVVVTILNPDGTQLALFDSPARGPEVYHFETSSEGTYTIKITPFEEEEGKYAMKLIKSEPVAKDPVGRINQMLCRYDNQEGPGAVVAVVKDGQEIFSNAYGLANVEHNIALTNESVFDIASVSKQFGAFSIALLVDQGKISLDDDIRSIIPEVPDFGHTITIRHLVHHMSGVRDWPATLALGGWRMDDVISFDQILRMVENQKDLNFIPGDEYVYSNTGYNLLAEVVNRVSGQSFREFTEEHIFKPLAMNATHFQDNHQEVVKNKVYAYGQGSEGYNQPANGLTALASSSLFTTASDLIKWCLNFEDKTVGSQQVHEMMNQKGVRNNGEEINYAFGQSLTDYKGTLRISHSGGWAGFRTYLVRFPEQSLSVIFLSNMSNANPGGDALRIADLYLDLPEEVSEEPANEIVENEHKDVVSVDLNLLTKYTGTFTIQAGPPADITLEDGHLFVQVAGQQRFELIPLSDSLFKVDVPGIDAKVTFHMGPDGLVNKGTLHQGGDIPLNRIEPWDPDENTLNEYTGRYYSPELDTHYEIEIEDGTLVARHFSNGSINLTEVEIDKFNGSTWYFSQVEFTRNEDGAISGMLISSGRVRNVKLNKV